MKKGGGIVQHKLEINHPLLNGKGYLIEGGWANQMILDYNPDTVTAKGTALKEWEYYLICNERYGIATTVVGAGQARIITIHFMDYKNKRAICADLPFLSQAPDLPRTAFGDIALEHEKGSLRYTYQNGICHIEGAMSDFGGTGPVRLELALTLPTKDLTVVAVPYNDPFYFYYNCKACCMPARGWIEFAGQRYELSEHDTFGTYDWGRGIWEPVNQWYWGSAGTRLNGIPFGFNIGHGFGSDAYATENMIFYDGVCHKFDKIEFHIPGDKIGDLKHRVPAECYSQPWEFVANDGRLNMTFTPVLDRNSGVKEEDGYPAGQHQVFGYFTGRAVLDDGTALPVERLFGFAEKVVNRW